MQKTEEKFFEKKVEQEKKSDFTCDYCGSPIIGGFVAKTSLGIVATCKSCIGKLFRERKKWHHS
jgi:transcription elongation factor Elf1